MRQILHKRVIKSTCRIWQNLLRLSISSHNWPFRKPYEHTYKHTHTCILWGHDVLYGSKYTCKCSCICKLWNGRPLCTYGSVYSIMSTSSPFIVRSSLWWQMGWHNPGHQKTLVFGCLCDLAGIWLHFCLYLISDGIK